MYDLHELCVCREIRSNHGLDWLIAFESLHSHCAFCLSNLFVLPEFASMGGESAGQPF